MKAGRTLPELAAEIQRQNEAKRDFLADTRQMVLLGGKELYIRKNGGSEPPVFEGAVRDIAHSQIGEELRIPRAFYDRLRANYPQLLDHNVNTLFAAEPKRRMVRTLDGAVRAFLSNRYRRLDNHDLANAVFPMLGEIPDVTFPSVEITEKRLYIKAVAPRVQGEVVPGDVIQAGVVISNSEIGWGRLAVSQMTYRLVCRNGAIGEDVVSRHHVGKRLGGDDDDSAELLSDETQAAIDKALWLELRDLVSHTVSETRFRETLRKMQMANSTEPIEDLPAAVEELGRRYNLQEGEQASVLTHLAAGGNLSLYGAANAVTRTAQDVASYDRATELETLGGRLIELPRNEWRQIARKN